MYPTNMCWQTLAWNWMVLSYLFGAERGLKFTVPGQGSEFLTFTAVYCPCFGITSNGQFRGFKVDFRITDQLQSAMAAYELLSLCLLYILSPTKSSRLYLIILASWLFTWVPEYLLWSLEIPGNQEAASNLVTCGAKNVLRGETLQPKWNHIIAFLTPKI